MPIDMSKKELTAKEMQSRGGKARARNLSKEQLREIARLGGLAVAGKPRKRKAKKKVRSLGGK